MRLYNLDNIINMIENLIIEKYLILNIQICDK